MNQHSQLSTYAIDSETLRMHERQENASCHMKVPLITRAFSKAEDILHPPIITVSTMIYVRNKITFVFTHEMHIRSLYISHESTL